MKGNYMNRKTNPAEESTWDIAPIPQEPIDIVEQVKEDKKKAKKQIVEDKSILTHPEFDIEGLMTDFPTATELERFVYDQTDVVLNLKGRANKVKYQIAMDVLNNVQVDSKFIGNDNPYIDRTELVPIDALKVVPSRDKSLPSLTEVQNTFYVPTFPHPDEEARAKDMKCHMVFRKYKNGMISYEILGPLQERPVGEKIDKFGRVRPEVIKWFDPRSGEQVVQREDGTLTQTGKKLRGTMQTYRVNKSNQWEVWVDREFISLNDSVKNNPWDLSR
jgi:hypothetical protein